MESQKFFDDLDGEPKPRYSNDKSQIAMVDDNQLEFEPDSREINNTMALPNQQQPNAPHPFS